MMKTLPPPPPLFIEPHEQLVIRCEIDAFAKALDRCYEELPPKAKACALEVSHSLAKLMTKLKP